MNKKIPLMIAIAAIASMLALAPPQLSGSATIALRTVPLERPDNSLSQCISEGVRIPDFPDAPPCCTGLAATEFMITDEYGGCPLTFDAPQVICAKCGDGECGFRETACSCPQDCVAQPQDLREMLNDTEYAKFESEIASLLQENYPKIYASSSQSQLLENLHSNNITLYNNLLAATENPYGMDNYLEPRGSLLTPISEADALRLIQSAASGAGDAAVEDKGDNWRACATAGGKQICCTIPKLYGPGKLLSCV